MPGEEETRHEVIPLEIECVLIAPWDDIAAAIEVLGPTTGGYTDSPRPRDKHRLESVLRAWGWYCDLFDVNGQGLNLRGLWGDWNWFEDDEKLMPVLAPFVEREGHIIFQDPQDARYNNGRDIRAWVFKNGGVELKSVDRVVEYFIDP